MIFFQIQCRLSLNCERWNVIFSGKRRWNDNIIFGRDILEGSQNGNIIFCGDILEGSISLWLTIIYMSLSLSPSLFLLFDNYNTLSYFIILVSDFLSNSV